MKSYFFFLPKQNYKAQKEPCGQYFQFRIRVKLLLSVVQGLPFFFACLQFGLLFCILIASFKYSTSICVSSDGDANVVFFVLYHGSSISTHIHTKKKKNGQEGYSPEQQHLIFAGEKKKKGTTQHNTRDLSLSSGQVANVNANNNGSVNGNGNTNVTMGNEEMRGTHSISSQTYPMTLPLQLPTLQLPPLQLPLPLPLSMPFAPTQNIDNMPLYGSTPVSLNSQQKPETSIPLVNPTNVMMNLFHNS
ncbi:hypothetical protein RFI_14910, partial [Reticulomyxa filosa]